MSHTDLLLGLPVELSGELVGRWLRVKDIVRLDSAFCQTAGRESLHHSIFRSSTCIITRVSYPSVQVSNWVAVRRIRAEHVSVSGKNDLISAQYLQTYGKHIRSIILSESSCDINVTISLIACFCTNLRFVDCVAFAEPNSFVELLNACPKIESLKVYSRGFSSLLHTAVEPKESSLRVHTLHMDCEKTWSDRILSMCVPESLVRLRVNDEDQLLGWSGFTSVRSLGFENSYRTLPEILDQCPNVVNLDLSVADNLNSELEEHMPPLRSLNIEDALVNGNSQILGHGFVQKHKHTLEALYLQHCERVTERTINLILAECPHLHTLSVDSHLLTDYKLVSNITTLITDLFHEDKSQLLQQHCRSLQHLHLVFKHSAVQENLTHLVEAVCQMPTLRALHFAGVTTKHKPACIDAAAELRVLRPSLCIEENEVEGAWYDLFKLPI